MDKETLEPEENENKKALHKAKLIWGSPDGLETLYINQMNVTFTGNEFYLVFGELCMPVIFDEKEFPDELTITPRVRLAIGPAAMNSIAQVLSDYVKSVKAN